MMTRKSSLWFTIIWWMPFYKDCKPDINTRRKEFPLAAIIYYLREVIDGKADRTDLDTAKRRISQVLDDSIIAQRDLKIPTPQPDDQLLEHSDYYIKPWREIDLSKLDVDKLKEEYQTAPHKHIEIGDLRAFISDKLKQMMDRNVTRISFAQKLQELIDRYNSGGANIENYFYDLMSFMEKMKDEEQRTAREGLTESQLEIFDLLKKRKPYQRRGTKGKTISKKPAKTTQGRKAHSTHK